jgi:hypothetical protein
MGLKKSFILGFGSALLLMACAASFPYKYYEYDIAHGSLIGATPKDDLPVSVCEAAPGTAYPCMIVRTEEFFKLKADYLKTKQGLIDCQHGNPPNP